jgi:hypothetical protein
MTNLKDIRKGDTWGFTIEAFEDDEVTPIDISGYSFNMVGTYANGTTAFTKNNAAFVETSTTKRTLTISKSDTAGYTVGDIYYQIDVTYPDTTQEQWMDGYINVKP